MRAEQRAFEDLRGPDLESDLEPNQKPARGIVVLNPPYGRRLGSRRTAEQTYSTVGRHLKSHFKGWKAAVLAPSRRLADLLRLRLRHFTILHGGQTLHVLVGKIPR